MEFTKNNLTSIAVYAYMIASPILAGYGITIDQGTFTSAIVGVSGLLIAIYSSKHPNTFKTLGNNRDDCA